MPDWPHLSGDEVVKALELLGFVRQRQRGSHVVMRKGSQGCVVPLHREVKIGTAVWLGPAGSSGRGRLPVCGKTFIALMRRRSASFQQFWKHPRIHARLSRNSCAVEGMVNVAGATLARRFPQWPGLSAPAIASKAKSFSLSPMLG